MKKVHFIAIGGAAMHNLALALNEKENYQITGSDDEIFEPSKSRLQEAGLLPSEYGWFPEKINKDLDAVILGMHAREDNPELLRAKELGIKIYSFPEYLYEQTKDKTRIVIGGSHGKTTTTAMILFVLNRLGIQADYMVGAQIEGFKNMVRLSDDAKFAIFEGDEYLTSPLDLRSKFHLYHPHIAQLTGIAWDHINVFPTFEIYVDQFKKFTDLIEPNGTLTYFVQDQELCKIAQNLRSDIKTLPYDTPSYEIQNGHTTISVENEKFELQIFGEHNLQNMMGALNVCRSIGIETKDFFNAIKHFSGAANRLQKIAETNNSVGFKDFAHSPSKLKATIKAVKMQYPKKELIACMELHTFSSLTKDFLPQYHDSMKLADRAFVFYNPEVIEHKRLQTISKEDVKNGFGDNVEIFTNSKDLQTELQKINYQNKVLLMMSSGNFSGINIEQFIKEQIL